MSRSTVSKAVEISRRVATEIELTSTELEIFSKLTQSLILALWQGH